MKKLYISTLLVSLLIPTFLYAADTDVDLDSNDALDKAYGGTNSNDGEIAGVFVMLADCSGITAGACIDTDNGNLYIWDGDSVAVSGVLNWIPLSGGTLTGELVVDELGIEGQPTDAITDCSGFAATGGGIFYDDSEGVWKKCQDNVLSVLDTNTGSATNFNDIGDATASGSIALAGYMQTITSTLNSAGANITLMNTAADLTADVSFFDFKLTDDGDTNGYFLRGYDNAGNDLKWYIGPGGTFYGYGFESLAADGEHYYSAINTAAITAAATAGRVAYYNGYHYIADGTDWNDYLMSKERMDTFAELDAIVTDKDLVNKADGAVWLGIHDFGGATVEIPNSDDPDIGAVGQVALDTDGWLRVYNGSIQYGKSLTETIHVTVIAPNDLADASRDAFVVWKNTSGMNFVITHWYAEAGTDNTTLNIETTDATGGTNATVDAVEIATDGTAIFTADDGTITAATIADGSRLLLDFDDTDAPTYVKMSIVGYYNGDVN